MKRILVLILAIIMAAAFLGCTGPAVKESEEAPAQNGAKAESGRITVKDFKGREVALDGIPQRIVSLSPSNTEILFALGAGDRVVGATSFCDYPEEAKAIERVGSFEGPNLELIKKVQPDVVLAGYLQEEAVKAMENMGIKVVVTEAESFDSIYDSIELVGKITGTEAKAKEVVDGMKKSMAEIAERSKGKQQPKVFYLVWLDPLTTAGADTYINDVIKAAGGINVAEKVQSWAEYSAEVLMKDNPDIVVAAYHSTDRGMTKEDISRNPLFSKLDAVKKGNVHVMSDDNIISRPGPRIVQAIEEMSVAFYGQ